MISPPTAIPATDPVENTNIPIMWRHLVVLAASSRPKQKPTTSLWEEIAPSKSKTCEVRIIC